MPESASVGFPTTQWTAVHGAGAPGTLGGAALSRLLNRYLAPLRTHLVLHLRIPLDRANDLLQGFIADKVLETDLIPSAERGKGRFRSYLLLALRRYVSNQHRNEHRRRRSPGAVGSLEDAPEAADAEPGPADAFDIEWAKQDLAHAARGMRKECTDAGRDDVWTVFDARVLRPALEGAGPVGYDQLVRDLGLRSEEAASNLLVTAKRMFARRLRGVVGEYTADGGDIELEIADLRAVLSRARQ